MNYIKVFFILPLDYFQNLEKTLHGFPLYCHSHFENSEINFRRDWQCLAAHSNFVVSEGIAVCSTWQKDCHRIVIIEQAFSGHPSLLSCDKIFTMNIMRFSRCPVQWILKVEEDGVEHDLTSFQWMLNRLNSLIYTKFIRSWLSLCYVHQIHFSLQV
jgi:hypothetical protein